MKPFGQEIERATAFQSACSKQLLLIFCASFLFSKALAAEDPIVQGTVTDQNLNPLAGVAIRLKSADQEVSLSTVTGANGQFYLPHKVCQLLSLEAIPNKKTSLATAWIDDISGEESRRMVIELQHGFEIHGRVLHDNKGLNGLSIFVSPAKDDPKTKKFVHGSGKARTNRNGSFELILTPGPKVLNVSNRRYPNLAPSLVRKLSVSTDSVIEDIELPATQSENKE